MITVGFHKSTPFTKKMETCMRPIMRRDLSPPHETGSICLCTLTLDEKWIPAICTFAHATTRSQVHAITNSVYCSLYASHFQLCLQFIHVHVALKSKRFGSCLWCMSVCTLSSLTKPYTVLSYFGKRKQVTKVTFCVIEQNASVISTDVNGISWCLT